MAEQTALRNNALPFPVYGAPFGVVFPILDADGDLVTGASSPDSEISKNGDTFGDCTNEATEIATSSGIYYLLLTGTELTADVVVVIVKTGTAGAKTTTITLYPRKLVALRAATAAGGAAGSITLDSGASAEDDFYNGCLVVAVLDSATEARIITDYTGSTKAAAVTPNWNTTPDSDDTFTIYLVEGPQLHQANVTHIGGVSVTSSGGRPEVNTTLIEGADASDTINAQVDTALADYDGPTHAELTSEINDVQADVLAVRNRLSTLVTKTGVVVDDAGNSATTFVTDLTESDSDYWKDAYLKMTSGSFTQQVKKISAYNGTSKAVTLATALTGEPAAGDTFEIVND